MNQKQEAALREYLQEAIVPLIEDVLTKKLGQAMTFAAEELIQPKREWVGLTNDDIWEVYKKHDSMQYMEFSRAIEAKLKEKNT